MIEVPVPSAAVKPNSKMSQPRTLFFKGGPTPCIHDALMELPLHGELVYQELQTDLKKAIQDNSSAASIR